MQQAVLPDKRVAFSYPQGLDVPGPAHGLDGTGDGDAFCNIFRVPGAAPAAHSPQSIVRYARSRIRAWERSAPDVSAGPVRTIRAGDRRAPLPSSATERTQHPRRVAWPSSPRVPTFSASNAARPRNASGPWIGGRSGRSSKASGPWAAEAVDPGERRWLFGGAALLLAAGSFTAVRVLDSTTPRRRPGPRPAGARTADRRRALSGATCRARRRSRGWHATTGSGR